MENEIKATYSAQTFKMDMGYFDKVLRKIRVYRAVYSLENFYKTFDQTQDRNILYNQS